MTIQETVTKEFKRRKIFKKEFVRLCKIEAEKRGIAFDDSVIYRFLKGHNSTSVEKLEIMCEVLGLHLTKIN